MNGIMLKDMLGRIAERGRALVEKRSLRFAGFVSRASSSNAGSERIDDLCRALLSGQGEASGVAIAGKVQEGGKRVQGDDVERARAQGATDLEIHDTVLIAAAFCMYNRYVDGLATWAPTEPDSYRTRAQAIAQHGYTSIPTAVSPARAASGLLAK